MDEDRWAMHDEAEAIDAQMAANGDDCRDWNAEAFWHEYLAAGEESLEWGGGGDGGKGGNTTHDFAL